VMSELIGSRNSTENTPGYYDISEEECKRIAEEIGADSVKYQTIEGLVNAIGFEDGKEKLCLGCLTGKYPTPKGNELVQKAIKNYSSGIKTRVYE